MTDTTEAPAPTLCACGCGNTPLRKRSRFLPGHDAQLKARLYQAIRNPETPKADVKAAVKMLDSFGWPHPVERKPKAAKVETVETADNGN